LLIDSFTDVKIPLIAKRILSLSGQPWDSFFARVAEEEMASAMGRKLRQNSETYDS
jgi:hypothetical protein